MPITGYTDKIFTEAGFSNWQKALEKFRKHEQTSSHCNAISMIKKPPRMLVRCSAQHMQPKRLKARRLYLTILSTIRFLARQGLSLRGNYLSNPSENYHGSEVQSNFWKLLQLRTEDVPVLESRLHRSQDPFTSPTIQNEVLEIMALTVLWKVVRNVSGQYFSIMVDETTDVVNTEQLVFCIWHVDDNLATHEEFIRMHMQP